MEKFLIISYGSKERIPQVKLIGVDGKKIKRLDAAIPAKVNFGDEIVLQDWADLMFETKRLPFDPSSDISLSVRPSSKRIFNDWVRDVDFIRRGETVIYHNNPVDLKRLMNVVEAKFLNGDKHRRRTEILDELINARERGERLSLIGS